MASEILTRDPDHRRAERVMGTVVSLYAPDGEAHSAGADEAFGWLHEVDERFSPFRPQSEVSRLIRGEFVTDALSADLREVMELASIVEAVSDGAFDIRRHRADGGPDPTGIVKGWAVDRAGSVLRDHGIERFSLGAGGDLLVRGGRDETEPWRIGIVDPQDRTSMLLAIEARDLAVATSGVSERGAHIVDARQGDAARGLLSVTVASEELWRADGYATAAIALGREGVDRLATLPGCSAVAVTEDQQVLATPAFARMASVDRATDPR